MSMSTDLSANDPPPPRKPKKWEERRRAHEEQVVESRSLMEQLVASSSELLAITKALPAGDVLYQGTLQIPAIGRISRDWIQRTEALTVANQGPTGIWVTTQTGQAAAPAQGVGVMYVAAGTMRTWPARTNVVTIYGTAGTSFDLAAFTAPRDPSAGQASGAQSGAVLIPAGTTVTTVAELVGLGAQRLVVVLNVAATAGSVTLAIAGVTPSGYSYPLLNGLAVAAPGVTPYRIGPALTPSLNAVANDVVPPNVLVTATVATSATFGVDFIVDGT